MLLMLIIIGISLLCVCLYLYLTSDKRLLAQIPGPRAWPIVGNTLGYILPPEKLFTYLRFLYKEYGGINQVYAINMKAVNIYDPIDIEKIMSTTRFNSKNIPYNFLKLWLCEGLLISNEEKWQQRRKLLTKAFHFNILKKYMQTFTERTEVFLKQVAQLEGKTVDLLPLISETTLNVICETTMGTSSTDSSLSLVSKYFKAVHEFGQIIAKRTCRVWLYFDFTFKFSSLSRLQKPLVRILHEFTTGIIKEKQKIFKNEDLIGTHDDSGMYGAQGQLALLDLLLQNESEGSIDLDGIREEVDTFMFEGHDTAAMAISFFIMRIANEPIAQNKIYEEMQRIFGESTRSPTTDDLSEMKYLECCIKETLRLYPSVPFITRHLTEEVVLSGYRVPRGTTCQIHIFDMQRSEKLYPRPEEFIPERFLLENTFQRHPYAYIPFSAGPRNCIGQKFAMLEMKTMLSGLLRRFRVEPITKSHELVFKADIVLRVNHPIYVRFCNRNGSKD